MDNDLRTKKTKKILKEALESLLRDKSLDDITVKEICEKASINRVTFYDHYFNKIKNQKNYLNYFKKILIPIFTDYFIVIRNRIDCAFSCKGYI